MADLSLVHEKVLRRIREKGLAHVLAWPIRRFVYNRRRIVLLERSLEPVLAKNRVSNRFALEPFRLEHLPALDRYFPEHRRVFAAFLDDGVQGFAALDHSDGDIAAIFWISTSPYFDRHHYRVLFDTAPRQIYQFAGEVAQPYRRSIAAVALLNFVYAFFRDRGFTSTLACVDDDNLYSLRFHLNLGFKPTGRAIDIHRLFGWQWNKEIRNE